MGHGVGHHIDISIHALREEGDPWRLISVRRSSKFLSTPSVRRATAYSFICGFSTGISIHALREEGDLQGSGLCSQAGQISIHALREEGDNRIMSMLESPRLFLSTPSARRATSAYQASAGSSTISIHALREEGDCRTLIPIIRFSNFYPRPPRGGRHDQNTELGRGQHHFYPRPP